MTDFASLGISIDTRPVVEGAKALDALADASVRVEQKVRNINGQMADTSKFMAAQAQAARDAAAANGALGGATTQLSMGQQLFIDKLRDQVATLGMSRSQLLAYQAAELGVTEETSKLIAEMKKFEDAAKAAADASAQATSSHINLIGAVKLLAASYAVIKIAEYVKDSALLNARYETLGIVMTVVGKNAGYTSEQMNAAAESMQKTGISMIESRKQAVRLVQAHIDLAESTKLARIAQDAAVIGNINSSEAFDRMIHGIQTGHPIILRTLGLNVNFEKSYETMAEQLGKTTNELSENEKMNARVAVVMQKGADIAGTYEAAMGTAGKQILSMQRYTEDLKVTIGEVFNETLTVAVMAFTDHLKDSNREVSELSKSGQLKAWGEEITNVLVAVADNANNVYQALKILVMTGAMVAAMGNTTPMDFAGRRAIMDSYKSDVDAALATDDRFSKALEQRRAARAEQEAAAIKTAEDHGKQLQNIMIYYANQLKTGVLSEVAYLKTVAATMQAFTGDNHHYTDTEGKTVKEKAPRVNQAENTELADHIKHLEALTAADKQHYEDLSKLDDMYHKGGELSDQQFYTNKRAYADAIAAAQIAGYDKEIATIKAYHNVAVGEAEKHVKQINEIEDKRAAAQARNAAESFRLDEEARLRQKAIVDASDDATNKYISQLNAESQKLEEANAGHETSKAAVERETVARLDLAIAYQNQFMAMQSTAGATQAELDKAPEVLKYLQDLRDASDRNANALDQQKSIADIKKQADQYEKAWDKSNKAIGDGLYSAIANGGGSAIKKLIKDMKEWFARLVLSPIISPIAAFGASLINPNAASAQGTAGGVMGGVSTLSGVSNMYSAGQSIWNGFAGGMSSSIGGVIASTGSALGLSAVSAFGSGMGMSMASAGAATAAGAVSAGVGITGTAAAATTAGAAIGAAIPYVAVALAIAKVLQLGFGHGARETTSQGIEGSFGGDGFTGTQFRNWKEKGGWFSSDIKGKQTPQLDAATQEQFSSGFATLKSVSSDFAKSLGLDAGSIANYSQQISLTLTSDATANQAAITKLFSDMGDTMATQLAPNLADFAKSGETSSATLQRLATSLSAANGMFDTLGQKLYATSLAGGDMASKLADLFGGLTNMQTVSAAYFGSFYSEQEKVDIATRQLTKNFADLGFAMPANNAALRAQIDALDLTTDAGRKSYVQLMGLSGAFASLTSATAQLAASSTAAAEAAAQAATQAAAAALDGLKSSASSAMAVLSKSVDAEKSGVKSALDAQLAIITAQQSAANAALQIETDKNAKIAALANALKSTLDGMQISGTQAADRASAQAQISQALSVAKLTGALPDSTTLTDALKTVAQPSENLFASFQDYARDYYKTSGAIGDLNTIAGKALTKSNSAISLAQDQLAALNNAATQAQTFYDRQIAQFDATLANAQAQLDVATGTNTAILSLTDAVKAFAASVAAATAATAAGQAAGQIASKPATTGDISGLYGSVLGRAPDAPGMAYWTDKAAGGASVAQIATGFYDSAEYKLDNLYSSVLGRAPDAAGMAFWTDRLNSGESIADVTGGFYNSDEYKRLNGSHANGLDSVPFDGYRAELHRGEMVLPAHVAQSVRGGSGNNDLTRELLAEIRKLRADLQAQNLAIAQNSRETAKLMRKWDGDGMPSTRTVTA